VRVRTIAWNTFGSLLHNRLLLLILVLFVSWILLMMTPLYMLRKEATLANAQRMESEVLTLVSLVMGALSGFGSLLAAWCTADAVAGEMKSGTILAVMARPVRRWEFLVGKFAGVQILLAFYVVGMLGLSHLFARLGGQHIQAPAWELLVYPMVRYAMYSAVALLLVTFLHQAVSLAVVWFMAILIPMVVPSGRPHLVPTLILKPLYYVLPSTGLLSESRFLAITESSLHRTSLLQHTITLAYGLDYALVVLLLALWSFRRKSLTRD